MFPTVTPASLCTVMREQCPIISTLFFTRGCVASVLEPQKARDTVFLEGRAVDDKDDRQTLQVVFHFPSGRLQSTIGLLHTTLSTQCCFSSRQMSLELCVEKLSLNKKIMKEKKSSDQISGGQSYQVQQLPYHLSS